MDDSEAQNEQNQVSQKNTPNASDGDTNENELSEETALLLDRNPSTQIMIIPKSKFVELSKGNTKIGDEVIYQKIVVKVKLPEIIFQGGTISRPENSVFNLGTEVCLCSTSEPSCSNLCLFIGVVWNRSNWDACSSSVICR